MAIDLEVISSSNKKRYREVRYFPKWAIYSAGGFGVLFLVVLIKALLPLMGMAWVLAFFWSQATTTRRN